MRAYLWYVYIVFIVLMHVLILSAVYLFAFYHIQIDKKVHTFYDA